MSYLSLPRLCRTLAILGLAAAMAAPAAAQRGRGAAQSEPEPLAVHTRAQIAELLDGVEAGGELAPAIERARAIFDEAIAYAPLDRPEAIRDAALALRMLEQLNAATTVARVPLLQYLRASGELASMVAFMVTPDDEVDRVYWRLSKIVDAFPEEAAALPALTAAISVTHEQPASKPHGPPVVSNPVEIFGYFRNLPGAAIDYKLLPPEILVYLVDTRATVGELEWAAMQFDGGRNLGAYYKSIAYDNQYFSGQAEKKIAGVPYTLSNIAQVGGTCGDQAYFAEHVGKAVGIPTMTSVGRGGTMGHAWIGFLRHRGRDYQWDFEEGRWPDYTDVRGEVIEPHTGQPISEAAVKLTLKLIQVDRAQVEEAIALKDAAQRLGGRALDRSYPPRAPAVGGASVAEARPAELEAQLELIEAALNRAPGRRDLWEAVIPLAESDAMTLAHRRRWADALLGFVERDQHDFVFEILKPMFNAEPPEHRIELWEWAVQEFRGRPDLICQSTIEQARALAARDAPRDKATALRLLEAVATRYANNTPWAVTAVFEAERLLSDGEAAREIIPLYARVFRRVNKPTGGISATLMSGSTYVRIGKRYQELLEAAGDVRMAQRIAAQLDASVRKPE
jgi:hypothetical protein